MPEHDRLIAERVAICPLRNARLQRLRPIDDGDMWSVTFAIVNWTDGVRERLEEPISRAVD